MKRLTALAFATLIIVSALVAIISQPAYAQTDEAPFSVPSVVFQTEGPGDNETAQEIENMLIVALGGVVAVVLFLAIILLRVLRKRKKAL